MPIKVGILANQGVLASLPENTESDSQTRH